MKTTLAGVGIAALSISVFHSVKALWKTYQERIHNKALEEKLEVARLQILKLEAKARSAEARLRDKDSTAEGASTPRRKVRVYIDGCFDMMHFGHSNALRQALAAGDELVVGLIGDAEVLANKGSLPVMPFEERLIAVKACKFVHEVISDAPYVLDKAWVDKLVTEHDIDYVVHGDDPCYGVDGQDAYGYAKSIGRFKMIKRTEGVSTTDIVGRMLLMSKEHHVRGSMDETAEPSHSTASSVFLATSRRLTQFSTGKAPGPTDTVVYISGAWDLFNVGHIKALEKAREFGSFLLVGIHDDDTVNRLQGGGFPILNVNERTLSVLSCRYVDEVIIGAPLVISEDMMKTMNISVVVRGTVNSEDVTAMGEAYEVPRRLGKLQTFASPSTVTVRDIIKRIMDHRDVYSKRYESKAAKEAEYIETHKQFVQES